LFTALGLRLQFTLVSQSKFLISANWVTGGIYKTSNNISDYFNLEIERTKISSGEYVRLKQLLLIKNTTQKVPIDTLMIDTTQLDYTIVGKNYKK